MNDEAGWVEPDEIGRKLILFGPGSVAATEFRAQLEQVLRAETVSALVVSAKGPDGVRPRPLLASWQALCAERGVAFLVLDDLPLARKMRADGVHVSTPAAVAAARRLLPPDALVGATVGLSHDDAMVAGEDGADYVMFAATEGHGPDDAASLVECVTWWSGIAVIPCAALVSPSAADVAAVAAAGADFIAPAATLWSGPANVAAAITEIVAAMGAS